MTGQLLIMIMSQTHRSQRWQRRKEARPAEVLDAALAEFFEKGFESARLEDIATRAGVSKGTIYLYFSSKEEIFDALVKGIPQANIEMLEVAAKDDSVPAPLMLRRFLQLAGGFLHDERSPPDRRKEERRERSHRRMLGIDRMKCALSDAAPNYGRQDP